MKKQIERVRRARVSKKQMSLKMESELKIKREYEKLDEELKQTFPASGPPGRYISPWEKRSQPQPW